MAKKEKAKKLNAKQRAYEKKQEAKGNKIVAWIIGVLIAAAAAYMILLATSY